MKKIFAVIIPILSMVGGYLIFNNFKKDIKNEVNAETPVSLKYDFSSGESWSVPSSVVTSIKEYSSSIYHDGSKNSYHLKFVNKANESQISSGTTQTLVGGATYDISYWVRSKDSTQKGTIQLCLFNNINPDKYYRFKTFTLNDSSTLSEWTEVKNRFIVPSDFTSIRASFIVSSIECEFYIDDLTFTPIENPDIMAKHTSFVADDSGNYGFFKKAGSLYQGKILELDEYDYYSIKLATTSNGKATVKFIDYRGQIIGSFDKNLTSGNNELVFKAPSCTYALLEVNELPSSYVLSKIGCNNIIKTDYNSEKNNLGTPFAVNQLEGAKHGFGYYISKYNCKNTKYPNFYYTGLGASSSFYFEPNKHFVFEYYIKVLNADSGFAFGNNLLLRPEHEFTNQDIYNINMFESTLVDDRQSVCTDGVLTGVYDGKWHKVTKIINPTAKSYIQFYWDVKDKTKGADVYIDEFKVTWCYSKYNLNSLDYVGEELNLYEYEDYSFTKKPTETISKIENSKLYIDGEVTSPIIYLEPNHYHYMKNESITRMAKSHLDLYSTYFGGLNYMWKKENGVEYIDYEEFDKSIYDLLSNGPNVRIMVNFGMFAPDWWALENPDEISLIYKSTTQTVRPSNNFSPDVANGVSYSSKKFIEEASNVLRQIYAHMKQQDYYNSIFALKISAGRTYEWMNYGMGTDFPGQLGDYAECSISAFKDYLKGKYGTISKLNSAWSSSYASFDAVQAPTYTERTSNSAGNTFFKNQKMVDFNLFVSEASSDMLLAFAKLMKELSENKKIVGAYNGYVWLGGSYTMIGTCHSTFDKVLTSPYIDFLASPLNYGERVLGQTSAFMTLNESVRANGKLYILEDDNRTSMAFKNNLGNDESDSLNTALGVAFNMDETIKYQKSDFANEFINGTGMWYYDMSGNWFDNDQYYQMLALEKDEMDYSNSQNINYVNDVALFVDETTNAYVASNSNTYCDQTLGYAYTYFRKELSRIGAGYDVYSMSTLKQGKVPNHKINIFTGVVNADDEDRAAINGLKKDGNILIFCGPTGYGNNNSWSASNISNLVGMTINNIDKSYGMRVKVTYNGIRSISYGAGGTSANYSTRINDNSVTKMGELTTKKYFTSYYTGLGMKDMGSWTSVYSSAWNVPAEVIRFFMNKAGAHIYNTDASDVIYSNSNYVGITASAAGQKAIKLPSSSAVYDVFAGKYISNTPVSEFSIKLDTFETKVFRLEEAKATVSIDVGNGPVSNQYSYGATINLQAADKQYYNFDGFYSGDTLISDSKQYSYTVQGPDTIVAKYTPKHYSIIFKDNGNIIKTCNYTIENQSSVSAPTLQEKENFVYRWEDYTLFSNETIIVNAVWTEARKYTISIDLGNGPVSNVYTNGDTIRLQASDKQYYNFAGFYSGNTLISESKDYTYYVHGDDTIVAKYTPKQYSIIFKDDGNVVKTCSYTIENQSSVSAPTLQEKEHFTYQWEDYTLFSSETITVNSVWTENEKHTVTFKNGNTAYSTIEVYDGESIPANLLPTNPIGETEFLGWKLNDELFNISTKITSDITLNASFAAPISYYTLTFKVDDAVVKIVENLQEGDVYFISTVTKPSKPGYTFEGWFTNGSKAGTSYTVSGDAVFVARFTENKKPESNNSSFGCFSSLSSISLLTTFVSSLGIVALCLKKKKEI